MAFLLEGSETGSRLGPKQVSYTHDAMIDLIIAHPMISQDEIARYFGYSVPWVSVIFNSDAFLARMAARKEELVDPTLVASLDERFRQMATVSMEIVLTKLQTTKDSKLAMAALELSAKALGMGARQSNVTVQNSFVVEMPVKAQSDVEWASAHQPRFYGAVRDAEVAVPKPSLKITDLIEPGIPG